MKNLLRNIIYFIFPTLRIGDVTILILDKELRRQFKKLKPGILLDVGSKESPYKKYLPYTEYYSLDVCEEYEPDICCDLQDIKWGSNYFDTVIATEVLEHLEEPKKAIEEIFRVLKPGGVCILSTRFFYPYHTDPKDYYRFTRDSLELLFSGFSDTMIYQHGNRLQTIWQILNHRNSRSYFKKLLAVILNIFNPLIALINFRDDEFPLGFIVYAKK